MKLTWLWLSMLIAGNAIAWTGYITNLNDQIYSIHPGSDLSGADFSGLNLTYAELEGANLSGANFNNSKLDFADLSGARLDEATFTNANLYATRFVNALLVDTSFISSHAKNADFSKAFGLFMVSSNSTFTAADFSKADMRYANLRDSVFDRADFSGSLLSNSTLTNNTYENTVFIGSDIENQFSASTNGVLTLDGLTEDYIARDSAISNWMQSAFVAADAALSNTLVQADASIINQAATNTQRVAEDAAQARAAMLSSVTATNEAQDVAMTELAEQITATNKAQDVAMTELADQITATNSTQDTSIAAINAQLDGSMVTNSAWVSNLSNVSTVGTATSYDSLLGTSVTNSTLERILQELTQPSESKETALGADGSRIDRLAQELLTDYHRDNSNDSKWLRNPIYPGNDASVIAQIINELSSDGYNRVSGENNLGSGVTNRSRLTKVIEEVMGTHYNAGASLGSGDSYSHSLVRRMAQELDGMNLDLNIGTNSTDIAMKRVSQEFASREFQFNTLSNNLQKSFGDMDFNDSVQYAYAAGVHQMVTNNIRSIDYFANVLGGEGVSSNINAESLASIINAQLDGSIVSNNPVEIYGLAAAGSIGEFSSGNDSGIKTNSTIERILQELAGSSIATSIGDGGSAIDRIAQELDGSNYDILNHLNYGRNQYSGSVIDRLVQSLSSLDDNLRYELHFKMNSDIGDTETGSNIWRIAMELDGLSIGPNIGDEGSAIDRLAQELSGSNDTNIYNLGTGNPYDSAIDKIGQELSGGSLSIYNLGSGSEYESAIDIIAQELSGSYNTNAYYLGSGNPDDSAIDKIGQELSGNSLPSYLKTGDPHDSAIDIIVQELSGNSLPSYLKTGDPHDSAIDIIVQELMGESLSYYDIGTSGTAMERIGQEFSDTEEAANTLSNRVGMVSNYFARVISSATIDINSSFNYFTNAFGGEGVSSNINAESLASIINAQLDGSIVSNNTALNYGLAAAGSIGEFSSFNDSDGIKTNSTIERILQELAGSSIEPNIGDRGSAIDRIAQELDASSIATNIGVEGSAIDRIAQELDASNYEILDYLYFGSEYSDPSYSVIDRLVQSLSNLDQYLQHEAYFEMHSKIGTTNSQPNVWKIAQELDGRNYEQLTSLNVSVDISGSAVDILVDAVDELDSSLYQTQQTNHTQAVAIQSLNTATNDLYALIAALQNQITTLSSKVHALENHQNMGQTTNWWDSVGSFDNIASNLVDGRVGSTVVSVNGGQASLQMNFETTSSLTEGWEPATNVNVVIPVGESDSQFFRMGFE